MKYDFTTILNRPGEFSLAVSKIPFMNTEIEEGFSKIPMWVADMSFPTAPPVLDAMRKRLDVPTFGYFEEPDEYFASIIAWHQERKHTFGLTWEQIGYENGVLGGVSSAVRAFTSPGDQILIHSPTYVGFTETVEGLGRKIIHSPLKCDEKGVWRMDFEDMDRVLRENKIHFAIFCSPHNPCGRVWERWEIEKAMEVYASNDCVVVSDEIWSDIIMPGHTHICTQSVSEDAKMRTIALYSAGKTFSIAGVVEGYHVIYNPYLRDRMDREGKLTHYNEHNSMSIYALIGAYRNGGEWADEMISVIDGNLKYACGFIHENFPGVEVMCPEGTYMLYLDCAEWCREHHTDISELQKRGVRKGVIWQNGETFMRPDTIRMNLALPLELEKEAFRRLKKFVFT